jgi:glutamate decarboxylase
LGIGENGVLHIPVHPYTNKIDIQRLVGTIERIKKEDNKIGKPTKFAAIVGIAGTTETGNIDDLEELSFIAHDIGAHYHIDAAWGGGALLMDGGKELMKGIDKADTVSLDTHKLLYGPNSMGICLFKDVADSRYLYHTSNYIIRKGSVDQGRFTIEGSRPFSCLKPWAAIKIIGRDGYKLIFDHAKDLQETFISLITKDPMFELLNRPDLFIVNYRFVPIELQSILNDCMVHPKKNSDRITLINKIINNINIELHKTIREHDMSFVSRTRLESTKYTPRKVVVLRAITVNPNTEKYMLKKILSEHRNMGIQIWQQMKNTHSDIIALLDTIQTSDAVKQRVG